jgi:hypothetical protein
MGAGELREYWLEQAFARAGIDRSHWRPNVGVADNRVIVEAVYAYYGRLYLDHPAFLWAGMASLVGPAFYAGFEDVGALPDRVRRLVSARALRRGDDPVAELSYYETTFLRMQQKIFEDQALMHEAYLGRGLAGVCELGDAGIVDAAMVRAWTQIDNGAPDAIAAGNRALLLREQFQIIDRYYHHMYERAPEGGAITYLMTLVGEPSLPGARAYAIVFPLTLRLGVGRGRRLALATPAADGNIAVFADRWRLITRDTLPAYRRLLATDAERARILMATPIAERVGRYRLLRRVGRLAFNSATGWRVRLLPTSQATDPDREPPPGVPAVGEGVVLDLRTASARERTLRFAQGPRCARPGRSFNLAVLLPGSRAFRTTATLLMLDDENTRGAGRLAVTLGPQAGLGGAARTLRGLAGEWGLDVAEVEEWREHAASVAGTYRHLYSTRVFQGHEIGGVRVELQVEHHVAEREFVLHAFFSWQTPTAT